MGTLLSTVIVLAMGAACARPGNPPGEDPVVVHSASIGVRVPLDRPDTTGLLSRAPAVKRAPNDAGTAPCVRSSAAFAPAPAASPGTTSAPDDAAERTRRTLEQQQKPLPRLGAVSDAAAGGAESCALILRLDLNLRQNHFGTLTETVIRDALTSTGLIRPEVQTDRFAASTGQACLVGVIIDGEPALSVAPLPADGICAP